MQYYCVKRKHIITEEQYKYCSACTQTTSEFYTWGQHGCATQKIVGNQNGNNFEINMYKLIRKFKLERILK